MQQVLTLRLADGRTIPVEVSATRTSNGDWLAAAVFRTALGPIRLAATASEAIVQAIFARAYPAQTAGWFDTLKNTISRIARSKAVTSVLESVATVANNPLLQKLTSLYPPAAAALSVIGKVASGTAAAQSLLSRAKGGEQKATLAIANVAKMAQGGSQGAQMLHNIFYAVNSQMQAGPNVQQAVAQRAQSSMPNWFPPISAGAAVAQPETDELVRFIQLVRQT